MKQTHIIPLLLLIVIGVALYHGTKKTSEVSPVPESNTVADQVSTAAEESTPAEEEISEDDIDTTAAPETNDSATEQSQPEPPATVREFTLDSFSFGYSQDTITVQQGDTVTINLTNSGGFHDWVVDEFEAATAKISAGDTASVTFVADKKGSFEYYCSVGSHRAKGMVGTLVVE